MIMVADIILVPDMNATALTAFAKKECGLTFLAEDYEKWDYLVDLDGKAISGRGKRFEVLTWKPGRNICSDEVRKHFQEKGFSGHTAAFTAWLAQRSPEGYYASIPEDNDCLCTYRERRVPFFYFDGGRRILICYWMRDYWSGNLCFVAFREL